MTRFNISLDEGVNLVTFAFRDMIGGETYIPKMKSIRIFDLVNIFKPKKGYKLIGIRPGEKLHEELISNSDSSYKIEFKKYFLVLPSTSDKDSAKNFLQNSNKEKGKILKNNFSYNSLDSGDFLNLKDIKSIINKL